VRRSAEPSSAGRPEKDSAGQRLDLSGIHRPVPLEHPTRPSWPEKSRQGLTAVTFVPVPGLLRPRVGRRIVSRLAVAHPATRRQRVGIRVLRPVAAGCRIAIVVMSIWVQLLGTDSGRRTSATGQLFVSSARKLAAERFKVSSGTSRWMAPLIEAFDQIGKLLADRP
jgi:hypothetical protein